MPTVTGRWVELADGVYARRYAELDLTVGLVVGAERALVVDTRGDAAQGAELAAAARARTDLPLLVALTHAHFDHCFGTSAFTGGTDPPPVYAQRGCAPALASSAAAQRAEWVDYYRRRGDPDTAAALAGSPVVPPSHLVERRVELDLGGRTVTLLHPGPGHTDHDLVAHVPAAGVLFAGDLVEQGAPPDFTDADPLAWPSAMDTLLAMAPDTVVPGHGEPVDRAFVAAQRSELDTVATLCRAVADGTLAGPDAVRASPYPEVATRAALLRVTGTGAPG